MGPGRRSEKLRCLRGARERRVGRLLPGPPERADLVAVLRLGGEPRVTVAGDVRAARRQQRERAAGARRRAVHFESGLVGRVVRPADVDAALGGGYRACARRRVRDPEQRGGFDHGVLTADQQREHQERTTCGVARYGDHKGSAIANRSTTVTLSIEVASVALPASLVRLTARVRAPTTGAQEAGWGRRSTYGHSARYSSRVRPGTSFAPRSPSLVGSRSWSTSSSQPHAACTGATSCSPSSGRSMTSNTPATPSARPSTFSGARSAPKRSSAAAMRR